MNLEQTGKHSVEEMKDMVFHSYFDKKVIQYPVVRDGKSVETYLEFKDGRLSAHFEKLNQKYSFKRSRQDLLTEYIYQSFEAIQKFEPKVEDRKSGWEAILNGQDKHLENQLLKYIKTTVMYEMWKFANPDALKTSTMQDGEKVHYILVMEMESLDSLLYGDYEDSMPMQLSDESAVFDNTMYSYYITFFQKWFDERREDILQPSQVKFLGDLRNLSRDHYLTPEEFEEVTGVKWRNYSKRLRRIEDRIVKAWEKENPTNKSRKQIGLEPKIKYLQGFLDMVEDFKYRDEELETQNLRLTDYLINGMNDREVEYDVFKITNEVFKLEELKLFNRLTNNKNAERVPLRASSLIKVIDRAEQMLQSLLEDYERDAVEYDVRKVKVNDTSKPEIRNTVEKTEITIYRKNGELICKRAELIKSEPSNVFYMLPTGVMRSQKSKRR